MAKRYASLQMMVLCLLFFLCTQTVRGASADELYPPLPDTVQVPQLIYTADPGYVELYNLCWRIAYKNMKHRPGMVQTPFIDEGFGESDNQNWIWDTCFMVMFCKYAPRDFPGVETLNNFYAPLHDKRAIPEYIHLADNPPLFAWAEYQNARLTGDTVHVRKLLRETRYLQRHFAFLEALTASQTLPHVTNRTHWRKSAKGYYWEGGCSGMDNTVRGRLANEKLNRARPNNPNMLWIDAISQQALSCTMIAALAEIDGDAQTAEQYRQWARAFADTVNRYYWDDSAHCYFDIDARTLEKYPILTPASYWPLLARIASDTQAGCMVAHLTDSAQLGTPVPWPSLSAADRDFDAVTGDYWRGAVWLPTAYMGIKGLENYGYFDLAHAQAERIVRQQLAVYRTYEPHTIWECYSPTQCRPSTEFGRVCRPHFCGWSALGPISLMIENVIGLHSIDAFAREIKWHRVPHDGRIGIEKLRFGTIQTDLISENDTVFVKSSAPYTLVINGKKYAVRAGENNFNVPMRAGASESVPTHNRESVRQ